jgi:hypothetical protein
MGMSQTNPEEALIWGILNTVDEDLGLDVDMERIERLMAPSEPQSVQQPVQPSPKSTKKPKTLFRLWSW